MLIGSLALAGIGIPGTKIGFAGFHSKDIILEAAYGAHSTQGILAYILGTIAAFLTAFYSWRLLFMTFHGETRADAHTYDHAHEAPKVMTYPLAILALGAVVAGMAGYGVFVGSGMEGFWGASILDLNDSIEKAHHVPFWAKALPVVMGVLGIAGAYFVYRLRPGTDELLARKLRPLYLFSFNKWYFDELYDRLFVRPARVIGFGLWKGGDGAVIDRLGPDGIAATTQSASRRTSLLQSGYVYHYAFAMLIGVFVLVTWYFLSQLG
jgi:NADH-quinone oxidoreductase subunit L